MRDDADHHLLPCGVAPRFGIRAKLWLAFGAVAAMTVLASFVALRSFDIAGQAIDKITQKRLPVLAAMTRMTQQGSLLLATVPSLIHAESLETLRRNEHKITMAEEAFVTAQNEARAALESNGDTTSINAVRDLSSRISAHMQILQSAMEHRWLLMAQQDALSRRIQASPQIMPSPQLVEIAKHIPHAPLIHLPTIEEVVTSKFPVGSHDADALRRLMSLRRGEISMLSMATKQLDHIRFHSYTLDTEIENLINTWQSSGETERTTVITNLHESRLILFLTSGIALIGALAIAWLYVGHHVVRRISALSESMLSIADGNSNAIIPSGGNDEVTRMASALSIFRDAMQSLSRVAQHDHLTGLLNRTGLTERGAAHVAEDSPGALIYLNLDAFKDINDTFGHDAGDRILIDVAQNLQTSSDSSWLLARLGGDDFAILVPNCDAATAGHHARHIQDTLAASSRSNTATPDLRAAIGIACFPNDGNTIENLLQRADMAMNAARSTTETPIRFYEPTLGSAAEHRKTIRAELHKGLDGGQFHLVYQPKIEITSGRIVGTESLLRWTHPEHGTIPPGDFIPVAERSGFIQPLGSWVLWEACRQAKSWIDDGFDLSIAVNFSASQFLQSGVVQRIERVLDETALPPEKLEIEITESIFLRGEVDVLRRLKELRDRGIGLALDDFGTGYSSLSYLKRLPVSCLKIDQSFVRDMFLHDHDTRITAAIIRMAHELGLTVVAEGIEDDQQLSFFRDSGCDIGQGFLFARPMEAEQLPSFITKGSQTGGSLCNA
ncbi:MAG: EAL domain-containing protein [Rhodospirillaceae bacterium]|nr:EAL domain-containing protein [Rhodospirillaceae bacterium]